MRVGSRGSFFVVREAVEGAVWAADVEERHPRVVTIVHFKHWTGRLYFNVIRPFHHLVVSEMAHAGARGLRAGANPVGEVPVWLSFQRVSDGSLGRVSLSCARDDMARAAAGESKSKRPTRQR